MTKSFRLLLLLLVILALQPACVLGKLLTPGSGAVQFTGHWPTPGLGTRAIPASAAQIQVTLSGDGLTQPLRQNAFQGSPPQATFTILFQSVPLGAKQVGVTVLDANNQVLTSATASVVVSGGQTVDAVIELSGSTPVVNVGPSPSPSQTPTVIVGTATPTPTPTPIPSPTPSPGPTVFVVTTLAGDAPGLVDGTGTVARFQSPFGIGIDSTGNLLVGDGGGHNVRKVTTAGVVTTVAGSGTPGFADGPAATAQFNQPSDPRVDAAGNIFLTDIKNHRVRKIDTSGNVTTFTGSGVAGFADGPPGAFAGSAEFNLPLGLVLDLAGNAYVGDQLNHRVRKVDTSGNVTTYAGSGVAGFADGPAATAQFNQPARLALDGAGNLYVADIMNHRIRKIDTSGNVTTVAGSSVAGFADGTGASAQFNQPGGVAVDSSGNLYVTEFVGHRIRKIAPGGVVTTIAGDGTVGSTNGTGSNARVNQPLGIAVDSAGTLYVADSGNSRIRKLQPFASDQIPAGTLLGVFSVGTSPRIPDVDASGNVWVPNHDTDNVTKLSKDGAVLGTFNTGQSGPLAVAIDAAGNAWVTHYDNGLGNEVVKFSPAGVIVGAFATGQFGPLAIRFDAAGNAWVANSENDTAPGIDGNKVTKYASDGTVLGNFSVGVGAHGVAIDGSGNVWVSNFNGASGNSLTKLANDGSPIGTFPLGSQPDQIDVDSGGNVWAPLQGSNTLVKVSPSGSVLTTIAAGLIPVAVAVDTNDAVWLTNRGETKVMHLSSSGSPIGTYTVGNTPGPLGITIDPNNPFVWVTVWTENTVWKLATGGTKGRN